MTATNVVDLTLLKRAKAIERMTNGLGDLLEKSTGYPASEESLKMFRELAEEGYDLNEAAPPTA